MTGLKILISALLILILILIAQFAMLIILVAIIKSNKKVTNKK